MSRTINYNFYHWGPFLYKSILEPTEINSIKKLCSKKSKHFNENLAGLIKHEHKIDTKKLFPILFPYIQSYMQAHLDYGSTPLGNKIELITSWVNYMTKFESNPLHTHDEDLSFVIFIKVPKKLKEEFKNNKGNTKPGGINFVYTLYDNKYLLNQHNFFPEVGDCFIFPSCLHHFVNSFKCDAERISISGNLRITNG
jgi:hypothetical protein